MIIIILFIQKGFIISWHRLVSVPTPGGVPTLLRPEKLKQKEFIRGRVLGQGFIYMYANYGPQRCPDILICVLKKGLTFLLKIVGPGDQWKGELYWFTGSFSGHGPPHQW